MIQSTLRYERKTNIG